MLLVFVVDGLSPFHSSLSPRMANIFLFMSDYHPAHGTY